MRGQATAESTKKVNFYFGNFLSKKINMKMQIQVKVRNILAKQKTWIFLEAVKNSVTTFLSSDEQCHNNTVFKRAIPDLFYIYFFVFHKQTIQFLRQINGNNVHPVYGGEIRSHNFHIMSLIP